MATKKKDEASGSASTKPSWVTNLENQKSGSASGSGSSGYRPLDSSGNDYASMVGMSDLDKAALDAAGQSWNKANAAGDQAGMDAAHRQAEAIRSQYGYSGGSDGSQYIPSGTSKKEFSHSSAPTYTSKYQSQIDELTEAMRSVTRILFITTQLAALGWVSVSYLIAIYATVRLGQVFPVVELSQQAIETILGVNVLKTV